MPVQNNPRRRGIVCYLTLDHDVIALLETLAPGPRSRGRFLSELVRAECARREDRQRTSHALQELWQEEQGVTSKV
jgi:hypothetical protein